MIVFYCLISIILTVILLMAVIIIFSSITIEVAKLKIDDIDNIATIMDAAPKKQYNTILENIDVLVKIKVNLFNIIPIKILSIDNKKIRAMLIKTKRKDVPNIYKKEKFKFIGKKIIEKYLKINNIKIDISLGMYNSYLTAISSALLMIMISIMMNYVTEDRIKKFKNEKKQDEYIQKRFTYKVNPVYKDTLVFKIGLSVKVTVQILSIVKENLMYKSNLFVNNTNKYKVKES